MSELRNKYAERSHHQRETSQRRAKKPHPKDQRYWPGYRTAMAVSLARKQGTPVIKLPLSRLKEEDFYGLPKIGLG